MQITLSAILNAVVPNFVPIAHIIRNTSITIAMLIPIQTDVGIKVPIKSFFFMNLLILSETFSIMLPREYISLFWTENI